ncbi:MAG: hypothetical protein AAF548_19215 [Actinomycetota bacterium]
MLGRRGMHHEDDGRTRAIVAAALTLTLVAPLLGIAATPAGAQDDIEDVPGFDPERDELEPIPEDLGIPGVFLPGEWGNTGDADGQGPATVEISGLDYLQTGYDLENIDPSLLDEIDAIRLKDSEEDPEVTRLPPTDPDEDLLPGQYRKAEAWWVVPYEATGIGDTIRLAGEVNETTIRIPVPDGTLPERMRATMSISPDVDSGFIEYQGSGAPTRVIDLGFRSERGTAPIQVELNLAGFEPRNGTISVTLRNRLRSDDPECTTTLIGAWVDFSSGVFVLEGDPEQPKTVGQFVPMLLEEVRIFTPSDPSRAEAEAATRITNAVVRNTLGNNPAIETRSMSAPDTVPTQAWDTTVRSIVISSDLPAGARLAQTVAGGVVMVIGGDSDEIERASKAWSGDLRDLMAGTTVDVIRYDPDGLAQLTPDGIPILVDLDGDGEFDRYDPKNPPDELLALEAEQRNAGDDTLEYSTGVERNVDENGELIEQIEEPRETKFTLEDLEVGRLRVTGLGTMEIPIFVDQASFGGPVQAVKMHVTGSYTPIAPGAQATMSVFLNGIMVDAINLENGDGHFEEEFEVQEQLLRRNTSMSIVVDYTPPSGWCRPGEIGFRFQVDPSSYFEVEPGEIIPPGFERFPQNLVPDEFHVALDSYDTERLDLALRLIAALQRTTPVALEPTFIQLDDAADIDGPVVMVAASGPDWLSSAPLLSTNPISVVNDERIERLRFDVDLPHAVLEAFEFYGDDRLILTWNSGDSEDRSLGLSYASDLVDSFSTRDESWKILFGDTYLLSAGSPPLAIAVRDDEIQPTPTLAAPDYIARARPLLIGAIFAALVAWVLNRLRVWRLRRKDEEDARRAMQLSMAHIADQLGDHGEGPIVADTAGPEPWQLDPDEPAS